MKLFLLYVFMSCVLTWSEVVLVTGLLVPVADQVVLKSALGWCLAASGGPRRTMWLPFPVKPYVTPCAAFLQCTGLSAQHVAIFLQVYTRASVQERDPTVFLNQELHRTVLSGNTSL